MRAIHLQSDLADLHRAAAGFIYSDFSGRGAGGARYNVLHAVTSASPFRPGAIEEQFDGEGRELFDLVAEQARQALAYLDAADPDVGLIHADFIPANCLFTPVREGWCVAIIDSRLPKHSSSAECSRAAPPRAHGRPPRIGLCLGHRHSPNSRSRTSSAPAP